MANLPAGTRVQCLVFDRRKFDGSEARSWASANGHRTGRTVTEGGQIMIRQESPGRFRRETFRQITLDDGVLAVVAVPKREDANPQGRRRRQKKKPFSWNDPVGWLMARLEDWE